MVDNMKREKKGRNVESKAKAGKCLVTLLIFGALLTSIFVGLFAVETVEAKNENYITTDETDAHVESSESGMLEGEDNFEVRTSVWIDEKNFDDGIHEGYDSNRRFIWSYGDGSGSLSDSETGLFTAWDDDGDHSIYFRTPSGHLHIDEDERLEKWLWVDLVYNEGVMEFYVDGELIGEEEGEVENFEYDFPIWLSATNEGRDEEQHRFFGDIGYFSLKVNGDYVTEWEINEGSGSTLNDESGNNNDGHMSGMAWETGDIPSYEWGVNGNGGSGITFSGDVGLLEDYWLQIVILIAVFLAYLYARTK